MEMLFDRDLVDERKTGLLIPCVFNLGRGIIRVT